MMTRWICIFDEYSRKEEWRWSKTIGEPRTDNNEKYYYIDLCEQQRRWGEQQRILNWSSPRGEDLHENVASTRRSCWCVTKWLILTLHINLSLSRERKVSTYLLSTYLSAVIDRLVRCSLAQKCPFALRVSINLSALKRKSPSPKQGKTSHTKALLLLS